MARHIRKPPANFIVHTQVSTHRAPGQRDHSDVIGVLLERRMFFLRDAVAHLTSCGVSNVAIATRQVHDELVEQAWGIHERRRNTHHGKARP